MRGLSIPGDLHEDAPYHGLWLLRFFAEACKLPNRDGRNLIGSMNARKTYRVLCSSRSLVMAKFDRTGHSSTFTLCQLVLHFLLIAET